LSLSSPYWLLHGALSSGSAGLLADMYHSRAAEAAPLRADARLARVQGRWQLGRFHSLPGAQQQQSGHGLAPRRERRLRGSDRRLGLQPPTPTRRATRCRRPARSPSRRRRPPASNPTGPWNSYGIRAQADKVDVWLNDTQVITNFVVDNLRPRKGHIGLQNHAGVTGPFRGALPEHPDQGPLVARWPAR
jgi:hypothetical protein